MSLPSLYLITDRHQVPDGDLRAAVMAAVVAGVRLVQLREKDLDGRELLALARALVGDLRPHGARLLINARADVALLAGAAGVHLPSDDPPIANMRSLLPSPALIGVSTHTEAEARDAAVAGADFVTFGPVYDTPSKRGMGIPVGVDAVVHVARSLAVPVFALGGVNAVRVRDLSEQGVRHVAVISAILSSGSDGVATRVAQIHGVLAGASNP